MCTNSEAHACDLHTTLASANLSFLAISVLYKTHAKT
jgi:hypothetical protein